MVKNLNQSTLKEVVKCKIAAFVNFAVDYRSERLHEVASKIERVVFITVIDAYSC